MTTERMNQIMATQRISNCCESSFYQDTCLNCGKTLSPPQISFDYSNENEVIIDNIMYSYEFTFTSTREEGNTDIYNNSDVNIDNRVKWVTVTDIEVQDEAESMFWYNTILEIESLITDWLPDQEFFYKAECEQDI